ncbi:MAG: hypothetical protein HFJ47_00185 [Clostridia bacterium]|nr:hypothetical protein [Clostridia bacterium]
MKRKILILLTCIVVVASVFCTIFVKDEKINNVLNNIQDKLIQEIIVSEETQQIADETKQATENKENVSTVELIESSEQEEQLVTDEGAIETDGVVEQENISYNGDFTGKGNNLLGEYQGLTYYSQADTRWANIMYSSTNNTSQTMKSSACGPTAGAMVVSSSKGAILPTTLANIAVDNGYRTANNGTAWAFFPFIADYFDFNEYHSTSNFDKMLSYLTQKDSKGNSKYFVIASCGSGLFTSGGHYIVLVADTNNVIQVYDSYLYSGKFNTASRREAGVVVDGNSVYVTEENFKKYANYKNFWIFSNDNIDKEVDTTIKNTETCTETSSVSKYSTQVGNIYKLKNRTILYANSNMQGTYYTYLKNTCIQVLNHVTDNIDYIYIKATNRYAYCYTSAYSSNIISTVQNSTVNQYKKLKSRTILYANSNMRGTYYTYLANTKVKILKNISSNVDYIYIEATKRYAYCYRNAYK